MCEGKKYISFSGGVESTTMCVLFGNKADAIFADTGFEHEQIYERIKAVEQWCKSFHRLDFKIHLVKNEKHGTLPDYIRKTRFYPSFQARFCTRLFKIEPIDNILKDFEEVEIMIGLNADEIDKRTGNHGLLKHVKYSYPLADAGITRDGCKIILNKVGLLPNFPPYMKRGGCVGCYYKSHKEYLAMAHLAPAEFQKVLDIETELNSEKTTRDKFFSILPNKTMQGIKNDALTSLFDASEMYAATNDATNCGVFCNR